MGRNFTPVDTSDEVLGYTSGQVFLRKSREGSGDTSCRAPGHENYHDLLQDSASYLVADLPGHVPAALPWHLVAGSLRHLGTSLSRLAVARLHRYLLAHWHILQGTGSHRHNPASLVGDIFTDVLGNTLALGGSDRLADLFNDQLASWSRDRAANLVRDLGGLGWNSSYDQ